MAEWGGTKTDWGTDDGVDNDEFNRIEGNIQYNYENVVDLLAQVVRWKSGRYTGNSQKDRFIRVGFTPDIVMIVESINGDGPEPYGITSHGGRVALFTKNHPVSRFAIKTSPFETVELVHTEIRANGFAVGVTQIAEGSNTRYTLYQWVALKIGQ